MIFARALLGTIPTFGDVRGHRAGVTFPKKHVLFTVFARVPVHLRGLR